MTSEQHQIDPTEPTSSSPTSGGSPRRRRGFQHPAGTARKVSVGAAAVLVVGTVGILTLTDSADARDGRDGDAVRNVDESGGPSNGQSNDGVTALPNDGWSDGALPSDGGWQGGERQDRGSGWQPSRPDGGFGGGTGGVDSSSGGFGGSRSGAS